MRPLIPLRLRLVVEPVIWAFAALAAVLLAGCDSPSPPSSPAKPQGNAVSAANPDPVPSPPPHAPETWWDRLTQTGGTVEHTRTYDGGGSATERTADGTGPGFRGVGDNVDVSKFNGSAPSASAGEQPGAVGGGLEASFLVKAGDKAEVILRVVCGLLGLLGLGYAAWLIRSRAAIKDAMIAALAGGALLVVALYPPVLVYALGFAVVVLLVRFGPAALQARAYEPARATIDGIATVEKRATEMADDGREMTFKSTREFMFAALKLMKSEIASQQTGNDREITRDLKARGLP